MRYIYLLLILMCYNCNNERVLQLPQIENADITEVLDVSPAYVFYDETQLDSTLLNRKNLISTTNWLVNIDKRLTLRQAIPHIKFLQDKKRNAELHKNKDAKNYFTCNDTSINNLGFIEFTDVYYEFSEPLDKSLDLLKLLPNDLNENFPFTDGFLELPIEINTDNKTELKNKIIKFIETLELSISDEMKITGFSLILYLEESLSFQDYISVKSQLEKLSTDKVRIDTNEFIY